MFEIHKSNGNIRTILCKEDIVFSNKAGLIEFKLLEETVIDGVEVYVFKEPFRVPSFRMFYASRIKNVKDKYLPELIKRLLYLNPNPDMFSRKKIAELIIYKFSATHPVESAVLTGRIVEAPNLWFEEVYELVTSINNSGVMRNFKVDNTDYILFPRNCSLSVAQKSDIRVSIRGSKACWHYNSMIGETIQILDEEKPTVKITYSKIKDSNRVIRSNGKPATLNTIKTHINRANERLLEEHNNWAPFFSDKIKDKYIEFVELGDMDLDSIVENLHISKSTAMEFRRLKENFNGNESIFRLTKENYTVEELSALAKQSIEDGKFKK